MTGQEDKARRARGDGGVHWDARRQRFIAEQTVGYNTMGKRVTRKASGKTEAAALRELRKRVRDFEAGLVVGSEHYRVKQAVEDWLDNGQGRTVAATRTRNRDLCNTHVIPKLGGRKVRDLRAEEVDAWLEGLTGSLATSTIGRVKSCLSRAVRRAMKRGYVDRNVVDLCDVPEGRKGRPSKSLTLAQAQDVLTRTKADPLHCYIVVSLVTGARTEELRALRWDDVHLEPPAHVDVWRSVRATGDTKTPRSRRSLALPALAVDLLREHKTIQHRTRLKSSAWADPGLVFTTTTGSAMDAANVRRDFRRALGNVPGLEPTQWTPRELRHSFVSLLSASGLSIEDISRLVGHKGTHVTELVYRHELRPVIQTGATAMDAILGQSAGKASSDA